MSSYRSARAVSKRASGRPRAAPARASSQPGLEALTVAVLSLAATAIALYDLLLLALNAR